LIPDYSFNPNARHNYGINSITLLEHRRMDCSYSYRRQLPYA
jgi:hypothetical protein